jgi:hypothetical protein
MSLFIFFILLCAHSVDLCDFCVSYTTVVYILSVLGSNHEPVNRI